MVEVGLIIGGGTLLGLFLIIKFINKFGVVKKKLPPLNVKRRLQASGNIRRTEEFCVQGKCFPTKPLARTYAEQIARRI